MKNLFLLVFSASIGNGHNQAARAFIEAWESRFPDQSEFIDFLSPQTPFDRFTQWGYEFLIQNCPCFYDIGYKITDIPFVGHLVRKATSFSTQSRLLWFLKSSKKEPSALVFTHPTPANAAASLKRAGIINFPLIGIITDYDIHQLWAEVGLDLYIIPDESFTPHLLHIGIPQSKISATGIPISQNFSNVPDTNLPSKTPLTVLIAGGGWGMGPLKETAHELESLSTSCKIIFIAGKNESLLLEMTKFAKTSRHDYELWGYTQEIARLISEADLYIAKSGGLSTSESVALGTPLLLLPGRAGQEKENARYFTQKGAALSIDSIKEIAPKIEALLATPSLLTTLKESALKSGKPHSAQQGANAVLNLLLKTNDN